MILLEQEVQAAKGRLKHRETCSQASSVEATLVRSQPLHLCKPRSSASIEEMARDATQIHVVKLSYHRPTTTTGADSFTGRPSIPEGIVPLRDLDIL